MQQFSAEVCLVLQGMPGLHAMLQHRRLPRVLLFTAVWLLYRTACCCWLQGQVYAMAVAAPALFTAGQDCSIRVWNFNEQAGIFMSAVSGAGSLQSQVFDFNS
jgi:hypothetical protein